MDQFRFLRTWCFANLKGTVGLIMAKASAMWITIPLDLSSRSFIPIPRFIRSRRPTPILSPSLFVRTESVMVKSKDDLLVNLRNLVNLRIFSFSLLV